VSDGPLRLMAEAPEMITGKQATRRPEIRENPGSSQPTATAEPCVRPIIEGIGGRNG
jgi:hypothetical protein